MSGVTRFARVIRNGLAEPSRLPIKIASRIYAMRRIGLFREHFIEGSKAGSLIIASYPKSGNTLFRFIWLNLIALQELDGRRIDFTSLDELMPSDQFFDDLRKPWPFTSLPCLLKSHLPCIPLYRGRKAIHLVRNPFDAMISNYKYFSARTGGPQAEHLSWLESHVFNGLKRYPGTLSDFIRDHFDDYCEHFTSWMSEEGSIPVAYEQLIGESRQTHVESIFNNLGLNVNAELIAEAIERSDRKSVKGLPASDKMAVLEGMHFVRNGGEGQWQEQLVEGDTAFMRERLRDHCIHPEQMKNEPYRLLLLQWPDACFSFAGEN